MACTHGIQLPARLSGPCRTGCLVPTLPSLSVIFRHPGWSQIPDSSGFSLSEAFPKDNSELVKRLRYSYVMHPSCKATTSFCSLPHRSYALSWLPCFELVMLAKWFYPLQMYLRLIPLRTNHLKRTLSFALIRMGTTNADVA